MRFRRPVAIAASIVVLALVVPFTLHLTLTPRVAHRVAPQDKLAALPEAAQPRHKVPANMPAGRRRPVATPAADVDRQGGASVQSLSPTASTSAARKVAA